MTDRHFDAYDDAPPAPRGAPLRGLVNGLGAVVSVGLVAGMAFWGWKLAVRDVSGVPVVRAIEGPMRVAPVTPGGMQAAYQGLSVNAVAAEGAAAPLPERIVLAPSPLPLEFQGDGAASLRSPQETERHDAAPVEAVLREGLTAIPPMVNAALQSDEMLNEATSRPQTLRLIPSDVPGVARSPLPPVRPSGDLVAEAAVQAALKALAPSIGVDLEPDKLTPGTRLVQLGAYDDEPAARAEWDRLAGRFGALMDGKRRVIQSAESGGRAFYRLRAAGFDDEAEARRFCAVLLAEQAACIPVLIR